MTAGSAEAGAEGAQEPQQSAAAGASQDGQWQQQGWQPHSSAEWWQRPYDDGSSSWPWQRDQAWSSYSGAGWGAYGYGSWQRQPWTPWSDGAGRDAAWGRDSSGQPKSSSQESRTAGGPEVSSGGGETEQQHATARRQSTSTMEDESWQGAEHPGSVDEDQVSSTKSQQPPKSGKDFIPEFDGTTPMREYQRRVQLFQVSTTIDPCYRAQKLMEKLTGTAWLATESIPLESLKHAEGVQRLLDHLWKELEPLEFLRTFQTLADFYKSFRRHKGQEFVAYDMEFRRHGQRLEEIGAGLTGVTKAYWFLEKAGLSPELRKQVVAAAGGQYDYTKLRSAVMAIVPQVHREEDGTSNHHGGGGTAPRQWRKSPAKVHATIEDEGDASKEEASQDDEAEMVPELLEEELHVLLTQAARKRAQVERARGFGASAGGGGKGGGKTESPDARAKRIAELKQRMPCSACKARGHTRYGHWHGDQECPYYQAPKSGKPVMAVVAEELSDSDEDYGPDPSEIFLAYGGQEYWCASAVTADETEVQHQLLALSDTCCARSVAGEKWASQHMSHLHQIGLDAYIVDEERPFRFGAGPRIMSKYSMVFPLNIPNASKIPWLRVSVVQQDVPLLLSKTALKGLGACLDLGQAKVTFTRLRTERQLVETSSGLCGFMINEMCNSVVEQPSFPPQAMIEGELEISEDSEKDDEGVCSSEMSGCKSSEECHVEAVQGDDCESFAKGLLEREDFSYESLEQLVELLPHMRIDKQRDINRPKKDHVKGIMAGLWTHGGFHGVSRASHQYALTVQYINRFMARQVDHHWTSFVVLKNVRTNLHRDVHNARGSLSASVSFGSFEGGMLWVADPNVSRDDPDFAVKKNRRGTYVKGRNVSTNRAPRLLDPKVEHATQGWVGTRWYISCFTSRGEEAMDGAMRASLRKLGFPLASKVSSTTRTSGESEVVCHASSHVQEPHNQGMERDSPIVRTPSEPAENPVAQPTSSIDQSVNFASGEREARDGQQVHDSQEKGRAGECDSGQDQLGKGGAQEARLREVETDLELGETQEARSPTSSGVEEAGSGGTSRPLRKRGSPRSRSSRRWTLGEMEESADRHGIGHVGEGSDGRPARGGPLLGIPAVRDLQDSHGHPHKSDQQGGLLGVCEVSPLPGDSSDDVWGTPHEGSAAGAGGGGQDPRVDGHQGHRSRLPQGEVREDRAPSTVHVVQRAAGRLVRWVVGESRSDSDRGVFRGRRGRSHDQHQPHRGGDADDQGDEACQGGREEVKCPSEALATAGASLRDGSEQSFSEQICNETCKPEAKPRSRSEVRRCVIEGLARRRAAKRGLVKRLLGNAKAIAASVMITSAAMLGMAAQSVPLGSIVRPDLLEVFAGEAQVTRSFSRWGWNAARPVDLSFDRDVCDAGERERILEWIDHNQPRLVVLSYPRRLFAMQASSSDTSQEKRRKYKKYCREKEVFEFAERVFERQLSRGDNALAEDPLPQGSFRDGPLQRIRNHPNVYAAIAEGLSRDVEGEEPCNKSALWMSTSIEVCQELAQKCPVQSNEGARPLARVAAAICKGYVRTLKRKDPSRIRRMLRQVAARIRGCRNPELIRDLRWNEKTVGKALARWSAVFAVDSRPGDQRTDTANDPPLEDSDGDEEMIAAEEHAPQGSEMPLRSGLAHDGISFQIPAGRKLSMEIQEGLKKAHCNLGHPSKSDFQRFLRLGGAKQDVVEAVEWMRCLSCAHSSRPKSHRTASIPPSAITFGDEVHLDCICVHDSGADSHWFLSIVDRATSFHILELLRDHSPEELNKAFDRAWSKWAGPPLRVSVDFEGGFRGSEFWQKVSEAGSSLVSIAGTAHWQAGKVERHNQTIKDMLRTVIRQTSAKGRESMRSVGREVAWAKNTLVREHGWSPVSMVFGKEPRVYGELHGEGEPIAYHPRVGDSGSEVARRMQYRYHAKLEYIKSQARHMLARTAQNRVRKITQPRVGQLVFFWRAERKKEPSRWVGPGYVVGLQGSNAWVAVGGRCFLVAGEHLREACGDEKHFGDPQIQKAIALFKRVPKETTFEDLTLQKDPTEEPMEVESQPITQEVSVEAGNLEEGIRDLPGPLQKLVKRIGWSQDELGNPVVVSRQAWAFRTPETRFELHRFPYRTTWARYHGVWQCWEHEVKWLELDNPNVYLPKAPAEILITVFQGRTKRDMCLEDVPQQIKRQKGEHAVNTVSFGKTVGKNKMKRMMEKEVPYEKIPLHERDLYHQAQEKEWNSWREFESCEILDEKESERVIKEMPHRVLPSRYVYRNKNAGLVDEQGNPLPTRPKARLCLQGHLCPDAQTGQVQVDSPTVERVSTMLFLHVAVSFGWVDNWYIGDISNAFLQGAPLVGKEPMYMRPPKQGLKGVRPNQILKLLKPVYGRPDAPRAWYEELARVLTGELGFLKSYIDPAVFMLRNEQGNLCGIMVVHVDDLMVCHDGSSYARHVVDKLGKRFPFGTWDKVPDKVEGVTYCGKEIRLKEIDGERCIVLSQDGFIDGRLEQMEVAKERKAHRRASRKRRRAGRIIAPSLEACSGSRLSLGQI